MRLLNWLNVRGVLQIFDDCHVNEVTSFTTLILDFIMKEKIEIAFGKTIDNYRRIFNSYYPAHNSTGFTERNLTYNFVKSLESVLGERSISWLEAPLGNKMHLDAVVFCPETKTSFLIEAKRLSNLPKKLYEIRSDIKRMSDFGHHKLLEKGLEFKVENRYAIVLSDVWLESQAKIDAHGNWPKCIHDGVVELEKTGEFSSLNTANDWKNKYHLLIAVLRISPDTFNKEIDK